MIGKLSHFVACSFTNLQILNLEIDGTNFQTYNGELNEEGITEKTNRLNDHECIELFNILVLRPQSGYGPQLSLFYLLNIFPIKLIQMLVMHS